MNAGAHVTDWGRLFFGNVPPAFLSEVVFRALVMYFALLFTLRFLGKQMNAQLSIIDLAVMISLGAIISLPMQSPRQGILPGILLLVLILLFQRGIGYLSFKSHRIGRVVYGKVETLVKNGVMQRQLMQAEAISKNELFAHLRKNNITNLGTVARVYREENGSLSIFPAAKTRPGLSTLPDKDRALMAAQEHEAGRRACCHCGDLAPEGAGEAGPCRSCGHRRWTQAVDRGR